MDKIWSTSARKIAAHIARGCRGGISVSPTAISRWPGHRPPAGHDPSAPGLPFLVHVPAQFFPIERLDPGRTNRLPYGTPTKFHLFRPLFISPNRDRSERPGAWRPCAVLLPDEFRAHRQSDDRSRARVFTAACSRHPGSRYENTVYDPESGQLTTGLVHGTTHACRRRQRHPFHAGRPTHALRAQSAGAKGPSASGHDRRGPPAHHDAVWDALASASVTALTASKRPRARCCAPIRPSWPSMKPPSAQAELYSAPGDGGKSPPEVPNKPRKLPPHGGGSASCRGEYDGALVVPWMNDAGS